MEEKDLKNYFETEFLKHTCFDNLDDLMKDKSQLETNMPRALIALELNGVWRGLKRLNDEPMFDYTHKHDGD